MHVRSGIATAAWALLAALGASPAHSDGVCEKGIRDTTAAERATITSVLEAAKNALPPAPQGWIIVGDDQVSAPTSICGDYELSPWRYEYTRYYQRVDDQAARNELIKAAADRSVADMEQKQPRLDAINARMQAIVARQVALVEKGDYTAAAAMNEQLASIQEEYKKVLDEGNVAEQNEAAFQEAARDQTMNIQVRVNSPTEWRTADAKAFKPPPGAVAAFRWTDSARGDVQEDSALLLLGHWKPPTSDHSELVRRANVPLSAAHGISIRVAADASRIAPMIDAMHFRDLAHMLARRGQPEF